METFSALLALCAGNSPVSGEFPAQRPVTRSFDVFFDLCLNKGWINNREAGDLRRHRAHFDVIVVPVDQTLCDFCSRNASANTFEWGSNLLLKNRMWWILIQCHYSKEKPLKKYFDWKLEQFRWFETLRDLNIRRLVGYWTKTSKLRVSNNLWGESVTEGGFPSQGRVMQNMMTSSNGNIFRVTGPLCGEFTGDRWIPRTKASDAELWCFLWFEPK